MINLKVIDNQLEPIENVIPITISNKTVELAAHLPVNASIYLKTNIHGEYYSPFGFVRTEEDFNIFSCSIVLLNNQVQYLKQKPTKAIKFEVVVNDALVEGSFKCSVHPQLLDTFSVNANVIKELQDKYTQLYADFYKDKYESPKFDKDSQPLAKGMVPVATGVGSEYNWDYPLDNLREHVIKLSQLVLDLSEQNSQLTKRVNELEVKVNEHVYEQYQL